MYCHLQASVVAMMSIASVPVFVFWETVAVLELASPNFELVD